MQRLKWFTIAHGRPAIPNLEPASSLEKLEDGALELMGSVTKPFLKTLTLYSSLNGVLHR